MNKKGFIKYYEGIKDEKDRANVLCEYDCFTYVSNFTYLLYCYLKSCIRSI